MSNPQTSFNNQFSQSSYGTSAPGFGAPAGGYARPHRGGLVLTLGIIGIVMSTVGAVLCPCTPMLGLALGVPAWLMGAADLKAINRGEMDPTGKGTTQAGMITGIVATVLGTLSSLFVLLFVIIYFGVIMAAIAGGAAH